MKTPISSLLFICIGLLGSIAYAQTPVTGTVSGIWTKANSPYLITGNISVPAGSKLTIEPGVKVQVQGYFGIQVKGAIAALGSATDSVYFTTADTTGYGQTGTPQGGWRGIFVTTDVNQDSSKFYYTDISFCKDTFKVNFPYPKLAAVAFFQANKAEMANSRIHHCKGNMTSAALAISYGKTHVHHCLIDNCLTPYKAQMIVPDAPITFEQAANIDFHDNEVRECFSPNGGIVTGGGFPDGHIHHNYIHHNQSSGNGGGIYAFGDGKMYIHHNRLTYNYSKGGGGGIAVYGLTIPTAYAILEANLIANNSNGESRDGICGTWEGGGGVWFRDVKIMMRNNIIVNNYTSAHGGGMWLYNVALDATNNTICNNQAGQPGWGTDGGGVYFRITSNTSYVGQLSNNIIYGNLDGIWGVPTAGEQITILSNFYGLKLAYNHVENASLLSYIVPGTLTANIDSNPLFVAPSAGAGDSFDGELADWHLLPTSPCINAGNPDTTACFLAALDFGGKTRVVNDTVDRGALEVFREGNVSISEAQFSPLHLSPNPSQGLLMVAFAASPTAQPLHIFSLQGKCLYETSLPAGETTLRLDLRAIGLPSGIYLLKINTQTARLLCE